MVGPTPQFEQAAAVSQPQTTIMAPTAEEEALKRNTDCVYFLASPLTCKKGSECEYRHSDIARVNPRDCWFWMNSNCLNPKCGFRHPPLDGLLGTQVPTSASSALPPQAASTPTAHVPNASGKQGVPCIFFQKGYCLKGDWCPFLHAPSSVTISNKNTQAPGMSTAEPASFKSTSGGPEKHTQEKKVPYITLEKSVGLPSHKSPAKAEPAPPRNEFAVGKKPLTTLDKNREFSSYGPTSISPANNGKQAGRPISVQQSHMLDENGSMNSKDAEEVSREPSPGFDVLVDDELRDSDYYPAEDQYGMTGDHEGRSEYDIDPSADYDSIADVDPGRYHDPRGYDSYERHQGQRAWEQHRASSERMSAGSGYLKRRHARVNSPDQVSETDLRRHLSKHRRGNGLRSVISHEYARDRNFEDQGYKISTGDAQPREGSLSSRLRGRIKLPGRSSSPLDGRDLHVDQEIIRGTDPGRSSFRRTQQASHHGRLRDRIQGKVEIDFNTGRMNNRGGNLIREVKSENNAEFAGPKSLAELKGWKNDETNEQQSLGKRKHAMLDGYQQTGVDLPFEGPKPLEEILKQKRREITASGNEKDKNQKDEGNEKIIKITSTVEDHRAPWSSPVKDSKSTTSPVNKDSKSATSSVNNDSKSASGDNGGAEKISTGNARELEAEDGTAVDDQVEDQEQHQAYEQKDGASDDYEQMDGEYYDDLEEGENGDAEEDYPDDEDGDDFAKKMGVVYS